MGPFPAWRPYLLPAHRPRIAPHIYTGEQIASLITAAGRLTPPLRAARHKTLIGLLAVTAMRPAEALAVDRDDVDLHHRVVLVRTGKQRKQREVPLHDSTVTAMDDYARQRDARFPQPVTPAFFISSRGGKGRSPRAEPDVHAADPPGRAGRQRCARQAAAL